MDARTAADALELLDAVIFNVVIGNADAHGKNFSILYAAAGPCLAPLYDLLSTGIYQQLSPQFVMKIGRQARLEGLSVRDWTLFAEQAELRPPFVLRRVEEVAGRISEVSEETAKGFVTYRFSDSAL